MTLTEPYSAPVAKRLIREVLRSGDLRFSGHARKEMANDRMVEVDVVNVLRGGTVEPGEWENGSWRYRVRTPQMAVVVAFRSEQVLVVVTAWRFS